VFCNFEASHTRPALEPQQSVALPLLGPVFQRRNRATRRGIIAAERLNFYAVFRTCSLTSSIPPAAKTTGVLLRRSGNCDHESGGCGHESGRHGHKSTSCFLKSAHLNLKSARCGLKSAHCGRESARCGHRSGRRDRSSRGRNLKSPRCDDESSRRDARAPRTHVYPSHKSYWSYPSYPFIARN
jgi:hypothetical protein